MSGNIFGCHILVGSVLLASREQGAERLLNILQCTGQAVHPSTESHPFKLSIVWRLRNTDLEEKHLLLSLKLFCFSGRLFFSVSAFMPSNCRLDI